MLMSTTIKPPSRLRERVREQRRLQRKEPGAVPNVAPPVPVTGPNPKKETCGGCQKRKEWLNKMIPGSGDLVEKITTATGIKAFVEARITESETGTSDTQERHRPEFDGPRTSGSRPSQVFDN